MIAPSRRGALIIVLATMFPVTTYSSEVSKKEITEAINKQIGQQKSCFSLADNNIRSWPLRVQRPLAMLSESRGGTGSPLDPILSAMKVAGYLKIVTVEPDSIELPFDVITPSEDAKRWWDTKDGFCVGRKAVADVQEWTVPGAGSGTPIQVNYTWHLIDVPSWAKRSEFNRIEGMQKPAASMTILMKTNKGWKVAF